MIKRAAKKVFPPGSRGFMILKKAAVVAGLASVLPLHELQYSDWADRVEPLNWSPLRELSYQPLISIVVPVFNPPAMHFLPMVYSAVNQTYDNWQLVLINASTDQQCRDFTQQAAHIDKRITVVDLPENLGIGGNTNAGIEKARGEYVALLDHDDTLAPQALYEVALTLQAKRKPQLIYSDEDKLTSNGENRVDPHFKPDWSPQLLRELNYINHFSVIEKALFDKVGGYRSGFDGAQDYDLFLRLVDETSRIIHIPKVLYHWRTAKTSTAENFSQKKNVLDAGVKALEDHLGRNRQRGQITPVEDQPGFYEIEYEFDDNQRLAVLVLPSPLRAEYRKYVYLFLKNLGQAGRPVDVYLQKLEVPLKNIAGNISVHYISEKNRKKFVESALRSIDAEVCLVVGCALLPKGQKWLTSLLGLLSQVKEVKVAAPLLFGGDRETIVDAGLAKTARGYIPLFEGYPDHQHTAFGNSDWARNIDAVSGRCFMVRTDTLRTQLSLLQEDNQAIFSPEFFAPLASNHGVVVWPFSRLIYAGEMMLPAKAGSHFNENLAVTKTEFSTFEAMSIARDYRDE